MTERRSVGIIPAMDTPGTQDRPIFSAKLVINTFNQLEHTLDDFLEKVPYCPEHTSVWSPMLATVIQESWHALDSLWRQEARCSSLVRQVDNLKITDYFRFFGKYVGYRWVVFWADPPIQIRPFDAWVDQENYVRLPWWRAHGRTNGKRPDTRSGLVCASMRQKS